MAEDNQEIPKVLQEAVAVVEDVKSRPETFQRVVNMLGEPPQNEDWIIQNKQDFMGHGRGRAGSSQSSPSFAVLTGTKLGISGMHVIPGESDSKFTISVKRPNLGHTGSRTIWGEPLVVVEGYLLRSPKLLNPSQNKTEKRGVHRNWVLDQEGNTHVFDYWNEWVESGGMGSGINHGEEVKDADPINWKMVADALRDNPDKVVKNWWAKKYTK